MIEQDLNDADSTVKEMTDFSETRVENLEPKENKETSSAAAKKLKDKKSIKKRKQEDSDSSVIESSKDSSVEHRPVNKYCILHGKYTDLYTMVNKHIQKKRGISSFMKKKQAAQYAS